MEDKHGGCRGTVEEVKGDGTHVSASEVEQSLEVHVLEQDFGDMEIEDLDFNDLKKKSVQRCFQHAVSLMEPEILLDFFEELDMFAPVTTRIVRDIRELDTTSNKNRSIMDRMVRDPSKYCIFKEALARTGQVTLVDKLQDAEVSVHNEMKAQGHQCPCHDSTDCEALKELRYADDLLPYISQSVKALQQELIQLYLDRCTRVPVYPLDPDTMEEVDKLFVPPIMYQVDYTGKHTQATSYSDQHGPQRKVIQGYRDIFFNGDKRCKNVYITGEAGVGKTTLCESIVHTWCMAFSNGKCLKADEQVMVGFNLLFYISLRNSTNETTIEQMIENQLEIQNVPELLEKETCLIVLDGLDEWITQDTHHSSRFVTKGLPGRKLKGNFTILTTTRPWKLEVLRLKAAEIDKQISITGFSDRSVDTLVDRVTCILNEMYKEHKNSKDFVTLVEINDLKDLIQTPVLLMQMLCLWHGGNSIGHSQCDIYSNMIDRQLEYAEQVKDLNTQDVKRLEDMSILPKCLRERSNCQKYGDLLLALSRLAYQLLCNTTKESCLVFSHKQTEIHGLSKSQLEICLKVGLLTQHKVFGRITEKLKSVSFIHKTYQEFFAALFLSTQAEASTVGQLLTEMVHNLNSVLEMAKLLLFLCVMRPEISSTIFENIMEIVATDSRMQKYRSFWFDIESESLRLAERIQKVMLEILEEMEKSSLVIPKLRLDDLIIRKGHFTDLLTFSNNFESESIKSIYFNSLTLKPKEISSVQNPYAIYSSVFNSKSLVKLCVLDSSNCIDSHVLCNAVCNVRDSLRCLGLVAVKLMPLDRRIDDMIQTPHLISLVLRDLTLTHEQLELLAPRLSNLTEIKQLNLSNLKCDTHAKDMCSYTLDLSDIKSLEGLFLYELSVDNVIFNSSQLVECSIIALPTTEFLRNLRNAKNLQKLICLGMYRQVNAEALAEVLPGLLSMKSVDIQTVDFGIGGLTLSPRMDHLELVSLSNVTLSDIALRQFVDSLPMNGVTVYLHITVTPSENTITTPEYIRKSPDFEVTKDFRINAEDQIFMEFFTRGISDSD